MRCVAVILSFILATTSAFAQSSPGFTYGQVPTAGQWNSYFAAKQDTLGFTPLNQAGGTMTGKLTTAPATTSRSGFNLAIGVSPTTPSVGDVWMTSGGLYYRLGASTVGPLGAGTVSGPVSSVDGNVALFNGTTGLVLKDGGKGLPSGAIVGTTDTQTLTNKSISASQVNSGSLAAAQMPALTGDCTSSSGTVATTCTKTSGVSFGTAATLNVGVSANNIVQLNGSSQLPAVSGALLTGITAGGSLLNVQVFKTSGTYTRTSGASFGIVYSIGGGGAGGGAPATGGATLSVGGGGGSGAACILYNYSLPSSATVTIGAAGTGVSGAGGNSGTASSFNSTCTANGGGGGGVGGPATGPFAGSPGAGGSVSATGSIDTGGQPGITGVALTGTISGGSGGSTEFGGGGLGASVGTGSAAVGGAAVGFGSGGGGAAAGNSQAAQTGGAGKPGIVIVYEYR